MVVRVSIARQFVITTLKQKRFLDERREFVYDLLEVLTENLFGHLLSTIKKFMKGVFVV